MRLFCITASVSVGNELMWFSSSTSTYQLAAWLWPKLTSFTVSRISKATQNADCKAKKLPIYHRTVPSGLKLTISAMALLRQQNQAALKIVSYLLCLTGHRKKNARAPIACRSPIVSPKGTRRPAGDTMSHSQQLVRIFWSTYCVPVRYGHRTSPSRAREGHATQINHTTN